MHMSLLSTNSSSNEYNRTAKCWGCHDDEEFQSTQNKMGHWVGDKTQKGLVPDKCGHPCCMDCFNQYVQSELAKKVNRDDIACPICRRVDWLSPDQRSYIPIPPLGSAVPGLLILGSVCSAMAGVAATVGSSLLLQNTITRAVTHGFYVTVGSGVLTVAPTLFYQATSFVNRSNCLTIRQKLSDFVSSSFVFNQGDIEIQLSFYE